MSEPAFLSAGIATSKPCNHLGADSVDCKYWFWHKLIFCDDPSVATKYEHEREYGSPSETDEDKAGLDSHILRDDDDICGGCLVWRSIDYYC